MLDRYLDLTELLNFFWAVCVRVNIYLHRQYYAVIIPYSMLVIITAGSSRVDRIKPLIGSQSTLFVNAQGRHLCRTFIS